MDIRRFLEKRVEKNLNKIFLYYRDAKISYNEFDNKINQVANGFLKLGVKKGERICLMLPNIPEFLFSWFALAKIGAVMVPININFKINEANYILSHSEAIGLVTTKDYLDIAFELKKKNKRVKWIMVVDEDIEKDGVISFNRIVDSMPKSLKGIDIKDDDLASIIYTSGTTGFPKGAMHVHRNLTMTGEAFLVRTQIGPDDKVMVILPLFHINAQFYSTMGAIAAEASLILIKKFSASRFWEQAVRYQATEFNFIGAIGRILASRDIKEFRPEHKIRVAYGALITPDVYEVFTKRFHIPHVIDGYGLTEVPGVSQNPIGGVIKMRSIGLPAKHPDPNITFSEMKIVDDNGKELPSYEKGELIVKSPVMMKGYFKDKGKTAEAIKDGWFYTGDYAYKDEDGYFFFVDRKKDIIRRKGENISATEVESIINAHPSVLETAVIAVPAELGEDEVMALIVLKDNARLTPEDVIDWCWDKLATFKIPRYIQFRKQLPKTATERIAKYILKKEKDLLKNAFDMESYIKSKGR
ncbi:MAG: AMP-binding protein [Deltaproteobacteria bacterium]|nr:AMP-binding protein [Deltaproteobacteria bacterium]